ncbi:MAG: histidine phosphatase family protein [Ahrensia sp.]
MIRPKVPFYLIRHGETDWNREERFQGQTDIAMNANGRAQASANGKLLAQAVSDWSQWRFFASPLGRTRETMELMRAAIGLPPQDYSTDRRLIELTFGDWEGHTLSELETTIPEAVSERQNHKWDYRQPNGESYADGMVRVAPFFAELDQPTIIVTHGGIVRIVRQLVEGLGFNEAAGQAVPQDQLYYFDGETGGYL